MRTAILAVFSVLALVGRPEAAIYPPASLLEFWHGFPACVNAPKVPPENERRCVEARPDPSWPTEAKLERHLSRTEGFVSQSALDLARKEIDEALSFAPASGQAWHLSARLRLLRYDRKGARADLDRALALRPDDPHILATSSLVRQDDSEALQELGRALDREPDLIFALLTRAELNERRGNRDAADRDWQRLVRIAPDHPRVETHRIEVAVGRDDSEGALRILDARLARDPHNYVRRLRRASLLQTLGRHDAAVRDYSEIIGGDRTRTGWRYALDPPTSARLHFARALSQHAIGRFDEAKRDIAVALRRADKSVLLKIQTYLLSKGFVDVAVSGTSSPQLEEASASCMANAACGQGVSTLL